MKAKAKRPLVRKAPTKGAASVPDLEKRLAESLEREKEALEQQTATSEILRVISRSPGDVQPVFDAIAANAARLCDAVNGLVIRFDGRLLHLAAHYNVDPERLAAVRQSYPRPPSRGALSGRAVLMRAVVHVPDVSKDAEYTLPVATTIGYRSVLAVPMMRDDVVHGTILVARGHVAPFSGTHIALIQTFADQAVIAIENVRLFKELEERNRAVTEALEQQTATSEILRVISHSPTDVQPVLDAVAESAARLCGAVDAIIQRVEGDVIHRVAHFGAITSVSDVRPVTWATPSGRAILERRTIHVDDILEEFAQGNYLEARALQQASGFRTVLVVPLMREDAVIGIITIRRLEMSPFTGKQIELLQTFADQAVIAIENVRLFTELQTSNRKLTTALDQKTATGEILNVISSSPTSEKPVFQAIADSSVRLCAASFAVVATFDGEMLHLVAHKHVNSEGDRALAAAYPMRPNRAQMTGRAILERRVVHVADVTLDHEYVGASLGNRATLSVPLLRNGVPIGTITIARFEPLPFTEQQVALLQTFADQAVIAIENVRLFTELEARNSELTATSEILRVISTSPTNAQPVFDTIVENAVRLCEARFGAVFLLDGNLVRLAAHHNFDDRQLAVLHEQYPMPPNHGYVSGRTILTGGTIQISDVWRDEEYRSAGGVGAMKTGFQSLLGVPMLRGGRAIGTIVIYRTECGEFPDKHINLLKTFADQAVIAIENVRLFTELQDKNREITEALEQQTATSEILKVIASSPTDTQPVFDAIAENAGRLCSVGDGIIVLVDGDALRAVSAIGQFAAQTADYDARRIPASRESVAGRAILDRATIHITDLAGVSEAEFPEARALQRLFGHRTVLATPLLREGAALGAIMLFRFEVRPFSERQIELLKTFADQAVIAVENVRLFTELQASNRELTTALDTQTATSDILRVISRSQTDVQPVFDAILASAVRLLGAYAGSLTRVAGDQIVLAALTSTDDTGDAAQRARFPRSLHSEGEHARAIRDRAPVNVADAHTDPRVSDVAHAHARVRGYRSQVVVPLLRHHEAIGAIGVTRRDPGGFTDDEIALLETFADQAVISIENARLLSELQASNRELTTALDTQTATSDILRVISRSQTDVQPVFDAIMASAVRLLRAYTGVLTRIEGEQIELAALTSTDDAGDAATRARFPLPLQSEGAHTQAIRDRAPVNIADAETDPRASEALRAVARARGYRSVVAVPLLRHDEAVGAIAVTRHEPGGFTDDEIALLQTFADQAVIAIENARLLSELQARTQELTQSVDQLTALGEVGQAVSSSLDVDTVLNTIVGRAVELAGADGGTLYEYDERTETFELRVATNVDADVRRLQRTSHLRLGEGAVGMAGATREPVQIPDIAIDGAYDSRLRAALLRAGTRALLAVPLLREARIVGGLVVSRRTPGAFAPEVVSMLKTFATQSALALQNARLFREIAEKGTQLELASQHKSNFLASMSHELRTPLNAILGLNEMLLGQIYGEVPADMQAPLAQIQASGKHLLHLINNVLDLAKIEAGRMELSLQDYSVHDTVESVRATLRPLAADKGLAFTATLPEDLPLAYGDAGRIAQCLMNLAGNALKFTKAGTVEISVALNDGTLVYRVADTGIGIPPDKIAGLFTEFKQTDATIASEYGGTGLGLSISKKFVEMHGGRIWVESEMGKGSAFMFEVPLRVRTP
jgi:GAF domain-containing protein